MSTLEVARTTSPQPAPFGDARGITGGMVSAAIRFPRPAQFKGARLWALNGDPREFPAPASLDFPGARETGARVKAGDTRPRGPCQFEVSQAPWPTQQVETPAVARPRSGTF